jgi:hypothetical protein
MFFPMALLGDIPSVLGDALSLSLGVATFVLMWALVWALGRV